MYFVNNKYKNKGKMLDKTEIVNLEGFSLGTKNKLYKIENCEIKQINVMNKTLATPLASKKVMSKYKKLINYITEVLIDEDDDDSGDAYREALNQIEKFRLIIKNKYRHLLSKKELEIMSKQLVLLQKELNNKIIEIHNSYLEMLNKSTKRSR